MHDIHATYVEDPKNFVLDPLDDPWHDGGPGELKELVLAHAQELRDAENQILELTEIVKDVRECLVGVAHERDRASMTHIHRKSAFAAGDWTTN